MLLAIVLLCPSGAKAGDFKLTLSPVFLNAATDPGQSVTTTVRVTNGSTDTENISVGLMKFQAFDDSGRPELLEMQPNDDYAKWVTFTPAEFSVAPGMSQVVLVTFAPPADAALGYYYAVTFRRAGTPAASVTQETQLLGTAAVLALLEVRSPSETRDLAAVEFSTDRRWYDFLPVNFTVKLSNTGNIHLAPQGNIFIDKGSNTDLAILDVNQGLGNILPDSSRTFSVTWNDGTPLREENGKLKWDLNSLGKLRFGKYTAHLVMVYDNGQQDVPVEAAISFWVIPWQIILALLAIALLLFAGLWSIGRGLKRKWRQRSNAQT